MTKPGGVSGSFRDPGGFVFERDGRIFRVITRHSLDDWNVFSSSELFRELDRDRLLIGTHPAGPASLPEGLEPDAQVVEHERVPFVSYPYEWPFAMLKDAALLTLELLERALARDFVLKDATPYNVQFVGSRPVFIDVLSFARYREGEPWAGYNQFCKMFLYPLMLQAYRRIPFHSWLRSELEGIDPLTFSRLLSLRDRMRPGVLTHVQMHAWLQQRLAADPTSVRGEIRQARLPKQAIVKNVRGLRRLVERLHSAEEKTVWAEYEHTCSYSDAARQQKEEFVREAVAARRPQLVWDVGANVGRFSRIATERAGYVAAMDADAASIDLFYRQLRKERAENILPLVMNLANPSPDQGWQGRERRSLLARGKPDLILALALIHHVRIGANIPVESFLAWLATMESPLVIEFVSKDDARVKQLLLNKDYTYDDYNRAGFEACLARHFRLERSQSLEGGTRVLYFAHPISAGDRA
ncbi:MAG: methyltransferase [Candidatus Acidiferrales bacterium]